MSGATVPEDVAALFGGERYVEISDPVEAGAVRTFAAAVEDACAAYWGAPETMIAPPALLSAWNRPLPWAPHGGASKRGLELHFQVKERLDLPRAVVASAETELHAPIRPGDRVQSGQRLLSIEPPTTTKLGEGRYWTIEVIYRCAASGRLFGIEILRFFGYRPEEAA